MSSRNGEISKAAPLFSIGVTTYDRVELLIQTLSSILGQTFSDFEIIIGNDNPDRVLSGETLGIHDPRIRFVNKPQNLGELGNMNSLLAMARGRYFTWIADDDLYAPNFLREVQAVLSKFDFPLCVYTSYVIGSSVPAEISVDEEHIFSGREFLSLYLAGELKAIGTMGMFDREYLNNSGGLEDMTGGAMALYTEYLQIVKTGLIEKIAYIDAPLIIYRAHEGSWGCRIFDMNLFKKAGENLSGRSIEIFRRPELIEDFSQNLRRFLHRFMFEFIEIARASPHQSFNDRQLLEYLIFSRKYVSSLKGSVIYWRAIQCLGRVEAEIFWPFCKRWLSLLAPAKLMRRIAASVSARFRRIRSLTHR
jgi:glycosyltransferase involved in cell wall biosynthesis